MEHFPSNVEVLLSLTPHLRKLGLFECDCRGNGGEGSLLGYPIVLEVTHPRSWVGQSKLAPLICRLFVLGVLVLSLLEVDVCFPSSGSECEFCALHLLFAEGERPLNAGLLLALRHHRT